MIKKTTPLSTAPYKGVRDFYPRDMAIFNHITDTMRSVAEQFGFEEYQTSLLEPTELYLNKTSAEIVNEQTYTFTDRGDRSVTLRPEMTPSVTRLVAGRRRELPLPLKWYSIPNCFRYERPQKGRVREHWQLNCDIFGDTGVRGEIEIILLAHEIMKAFGARDEMFTIKLNNRTILTDTLTRVASDGGYELDENQTRAILRIMDRKEKLSPEEYANAMQEAVGAEIGRTLIDAHTPERVGAIMAELPSLQAFVALQEELHRLGITNIEHSTELVRGFDYYTGLVFEVFDTSGENTRSLFGGGRYDNLMELFGQEPIPAVGFGMGDTALRDFLETHKLLPSYQSRTTLYIATIGETFAGAEYVAQQLRAQDVSVSVNLGTKKLGEQIKQAESLGIEFLIAVGEDELRSGTFTLKHLPSRSERTVTLDDLAEALFSFEEHA